jgi:hypothetical protein
MSENQGEGAGDSSYGGGYDSSQTDSSSGFTFTNPGAAADQAASQPAANPYAGFTSSNFTGYTTGQAPPAIVPGSPSQPAATQESQDVSVKDKPSLMQRLGIVPGMSKDQFFSQETPAQRDDRMGIIGNAIGRVGNFALGGVASSMGLSPLMTGAKALAAYDASQKTDKPMSIGDALTAAATDILGNKAAGAINSEAAKALGPGMGQLNQLGSMYSLATGEKSPVPNIGADLVGQVKNALGLPGIPGSAPVSAPNGTDVMNASSGTGGWSKGGSIAQATPVAPTPAPQVVQNTVPANGIIGNYLDWFNAGRKKGA